MAPPYNRDRAGGDTRLAAPLESRFLHSFSIWRRRRKPERAGASRVHVGRPTCMVSRSSGRGGLALPAAVKNLRHARRHGVPSWLSTRATPIGAASNRIQRARSSWTPTTRCATRLPPFAITTYRRRGCRRPRRSAHDDPRGALKATSRARSIQSRRQSDRRHGTVVDCRTPPSASWMRRAFRSASSA